VLDGGPASLLHYGITDEMAAGVGLSCGGEIDVLVDLHDPEDPVWRAARLALQAGERVVLATGVSDPVRSRRVLFRDHDGSVGSLGSTEIDTALVDAIGPFLHQGGTAILPLEQSATGDVLEVFVEAFLPPPHLLIVGATPIAESLCHLASALDYRVTVVEPRAAFAREDRFQGAEGVIVAWPEEGLQEAGLDRYSSVVVLTHDEKLDVPALSAALRAEAEFVGLLGGRRTQRLRRGALSDLGLEPDRIETIHGPVGLDIGADTPAEIALSILAQMVAVRHGR
jgi:xanthine dehydrogenase accessory factor